MSTRAAVTGCVNLNPARLKKAVLAFDHVAVNLDTNAVSRRLRADIEWLTERGILIDALKPWIVERGAFDPGTIDVMKAYHEIFGGGSVNLAEFMVRILATYAARDLGWQVVPLGYGAGNHQSVWPSGHDSVLEVVLREMPEPDDDTPWEAVIEWRADEEAQVKLRRLKRWMGNLAEGNISPRNLEDEIRYLMDEYRRHMALHRIKTNTGVVKTLIVAAADVAGKVASLKWGEAAKAIFVLSERRIALMEAEAAAPGREVAYIVDAEARFRRPR